MKIKQIGKFKVFDVIGEGSFGKVYKGIDKTNNHEVALKFITRKNKSKRELDSLRQELDILKKLKHPNIIALKDHIELENQFIVITQFAGKDLSVVLEKEGKFKTQKVRYYAQQIISALLYLYDNRIVHRDLKPQNILIKDDIIKICDFGFARKMSAMTMCLHSMKGTPLYIAPEIISEKPYNHKVDVWSLGIILYQLASGRPPFYAESYQKLLPKILHDRVKYPKDMDLTLRDFIAGMLQKSPMSRSQWQAIPNHPFMKSKSPLSEMPAQSNLTTRKLNKYEDEIQQQFSVDPKIFRSSILANNKDKIQITQLRKIQDLIKQSKDKGRQFKTDIVFYHQMISIFSNQSSGETVSKEYLILTMRVLTRLITQVKLEAEEKEDDITKKPDLVYSVVAIIPTLEDDELLAQTYVMVGYLLKNNFDALKFDIDCGQKLIYSIINTLNREKIQKQVYLNIIKVVGIAASQLLATLKNSQQFFSIILNQKMLSLISSRFIPDKQPALLLFECLVKFVHPSKGESPNKSTQFLNTITELKLDLAKGLIQSPHSIPFFMKMAQTYAQSQLVNFNGVLYQCVKVSHQFRKAFINTRYCALFQKIPMFNIPMGYYMMKFQKAQVINIDVIKMQISKEGQIEYPIHRAFEINLLILSINTKTDLSVKLQQMKFYFKKISEILKIEEFKKQKSIEMLEGWAFDCLPYKFDDLAISAFMQLFSLDRTLQKELLKTCEQLNIFQDCIRCKDAEINISFKYFVRLIPFLINHYKQQKPSKKLTQNLIQALLIYLSPEQISRVMANQQKQGVVQYLKNCFLLIEEMANKDDKKLQQFFLQSDKIDLSRLLLNQQIIDQKMFPLLLKILNRMVQKCPPYILDFMAVSGLPKFSKYLSSKSDSLVVDIIQIVSHLARTKLQYYPRISQLNIIQHIPRWLTSQNQQLIYRTLNLVGNLSKHSMHFFSEFENHKVVGAIISSIHYTKSFQKNIIYAIGNISFYNQQFKEDIKHLIPYLVKTLDSQDDHLLSNVVSTLCNLLRHSNSYCKQILSYNILSKILTILQRTKNVNITQYGLNFILKATNYQELTNGQKQNIKKTLRKIVCAIDSQVGKKIQKIQQKLALL